MIAKRLGVRGEAPLWISPQPNQSGAPRRTPRRFAFTFALGLVLATTGCTFTKVSRKPDGSWAIRRVSFLQKVEIPEVEIGTNGTTLLRGYRSDGGNQAAAAVTEAAVTAAIKGMKP